MYWEYSASGTTETNTTHDNISLGKYVDVECVGAKAEGWGIIQFLSHSAESVFETWVRSIGSGKWGDRRTELDRTIKSK